MARKLIPDVAQVEPAGTHPLPGLPGNKVVRVDRDNFERDPYPGLEYNISLLQPGECVTIPKVVRDLRQVAWRRLHSRILSERRQHRAYTVRSLPDGLRLWRKS